MFWCDKGTSVDGMFLVWPALRRDVALVEGGGRCVCPGALRRLDTWLDAAGLGPSRQRPEYLRLRTFDTAAGEQLPRVRGRTPGLPPRGVRPRGTRRSSKAARAPAASATRPLFARPVALHCGKPVWSGRRGTRGGGRRGSHGAAATAAPGGHTRRLG